MTIMTKPEAITAENVTYEAMIIDTDPVDELASHESMEAISKATPINTWATVSIASMTAISLALNIEGLTAGHLSLFTVIMSAVAVIAGNVWLFRHWEKSRAKKGLASIHAETLGLFAKPKLTGNTVAKIAMFTSILVLATVASLFSIVVAVITIINFAIVLGYFMMDAVRAPKGMVSTDCP